MLRHGFGFHIGRRVHIGFSLFAGIHRCSIADDVRIGHLNAFVNMHELEIEDHVKIGFLNLFRGGDRVHIGRYATILRLNVMNSRPSTEAVNPTVPELRLGEGAVVTNGHWLDFTDRIELGDHAIIGGRNSSLWTHNRQRTRPISIGAHSYLGSEIRMAPGASVANCSIVSIGSVLTQRFEEDRVLICGNPARVRRPIRDRDFFLITRKTRSDIPDDIAARSLLKISPHIKLNDDGRTPMCGIAGSLDLRGDASDPAAVIAMTDRMIHRGPDACGYYSDGPVSLGHRRLSIIDLEGGAQPMQDDSGNLSITYNGELYNFLELRQTLTAAGHRFLTDSDTEVILKAYLEYGENSLEHFRGMFAFAIWDRRRQRLFLARDRVGKKPLFYTRTAGHFAFASELHALLAHPNISREIDPFALDEYLTYGYIPAPRTIFKSVRKLEPGHHLTGTFGPDGGPFETIIERYWKLEYGSKWVCDEHEAAERLLAELTEAVRLRLVADVPIGALLSGGVDSSVVVALMSRISGRQVKTFSIGFEEEDFNELPYARMVAERYSTDHHELVVRPQFMDILPTLVRHYGEPYADSSALPTYFVAQLTRQHVTVALNGDGADESLAGYERYFGVLLAESYRKVPRLLRERLIEPAASMIPVRLPRRSRLRQAKNFLQTASRPAPQQYLRWNTFFGSAEKTELYTEAFADRLQHSNSETWFLEKLEPVKGRPTLDALLATDVESYLPYDLLVKMDVATMANSMEARSPFLDHKVMEYCARLPVEYKIRGRTLKYLLKKMAVDLIPAANIKRRKMGFGVPVGRWMKGVQLDFVKETLLSPRALQRGYFRPEALRALVSKHSDAGEDYSQQLWALVWLEMWHQMFVD